LVIGENEQRTGEGINAKERSSGVKMFHITAPDFQADLIINDADMVIFVSEQARWMYGSTERQIRDHCESRGYSMEEKK
jgi:hypothetical protein